MAGFIAGVTAPPGRRMGHAGAIISGGKGKAESKLAGDEGRRYRYFTEPAALGQTLIEVLGSIRIVVQNKPRDRRHYPISDF